VSDEQCQSWYRWPQVPLAVEDLIGLVQVAAEGHTVLAPVAARRLIAAATDSRPARDRVRKLPGLLAHDAGIVSP
jgi:hypothetical protein